MNKKVAVIADVHSNLQALEKVIKEIEKHSVDEIWFLGDAVGYGGNPDEVCEIIKEKCSIIIAGNHDNAVCRNRSMDNFSYTAQKAILRTQKLLSRENTKWLCSLENNFQVEDTMLVHDALSDEDKYITNHYKVRQEHLLMDEQNIQILLCGHSHLAFFSDENYFNLSSESQIIPFSKERMIINPGSVGQPRDKNPNASFIIIDFNKKNIQYHRVKYDIESAQKAILKIKMPEAFANRLKSGH